MRLIDGYDIFLLDKNLRDAYDKFITLWEPIFTRNIEDGYRQYNSFKFIITTYPLLAPKLKHLANDMIKSGYEPLKVKAFLELYKVPCREIRLKHRAEALELEKLGKKSQTLIAREQHTKRLQGGVIPKGRGIPDTKGKNPKQEKLKKNNHGRQVSKVDTQQSLL